MRVMDTISDKPDWTRKVFDEEIVARWREELLATGQDVTPKMLDWIIKELQWKAKRFQKTGIFDVFDVGVVKSDTAVSEEQKHALQKAVAVLENVKERDYHPGSDDKVIDLVHPSLFPVVYGRTRVLPDRLIGLDDCLQSIGQGETLKVPSDEEVEPAVPGDSWLSGYGRNQLRGLKPYSQKFQWLPCDVKFTDDGCHIASYINNLHPSKHRPLYDVIEKILAQTIPLWDQTLTGSWNRASDRIVYKEVEYLEHTVPEPTVAEGEEEDDEFYERHDEWEDTRPVKKPEPGDFHPPVVEYGWEPIVLREQFRDEGLQVIVKLANIELTPEKPEYEGGSWHIEGQLNERICATAIYYYDSENITESTLAFRQRIDSETLEDVSYEQNRHSFANEVFGFAGDTFNNTNITQELGSVVCREGRLLTFPNILQHRVAPFALADRTKPGHRKILAFFLIDPHLRIISSANVPPQQEEWAKETQTTIAHVLDRKLPAELREMVKENIPNAYMTFEEAKQYRLELMEERSARSERQNAQFEEGMISLCEH
ncbi:conserved hypothetical protein [Aspergillus terreus NIH2624]|uniref:Uncharacterized protein n=1 Tax=Aspergillus terreus (strain NIH 2624 / FGSC A1156) TaxID=341663 RepID=Q0CUF1_ASPTN|nr:uncharacterized protein ATEG_02683 [Aspergillus terreus NIH2624]EAU37645.1 conserved hypothetical protein [Aspergillus terreus NIH2624]